MTENLCPDCKAKPGELHNHRCDVERCPMCGGQALFDDCEITLPRLPWTGEWPGISECRELGWFCLQVPGKGFIPCHPNIPDATPDLNRLLQEAQWSQEKARFVTKST